MNAATLQEFPSVLRQPFRPWGEELRNVCGVETGQRGVVYGRCAQALAAELSPAHAGGTWVTFESGGVGSNCPALRAWLHTPGTLARSHCVVRSFLPNAAMLRAALTPSAGALLQPGGRVVAIDWADGSFATAGQRHAPGEGSLARFAEVASQLTRRGHRAHMHRGAFHRTNAGVAQMLAPALHGEATTGACVEAFDPPESTWGALVYLVLEFPGGGSAA